MQVFEFAHSFVTMFIDKESPVELDGSQQARLINMRLRKEKQIAVDTHKELGNLRVLSKRTARETSRNALLHWTLHTKYAENHEDRIYEQVLNQLAAHGKASNLLEIEKYWAQNAMRSIGTNKDTWHDANICGSPQRIEDQYKIIQDLEFKLQQSGEHRAMEMPDPGPKLISMDIVSKDLICIPGFLENSNLDEEEQMNLVRYWTHSQPENLADEVSFHGCADADCDEITPDSHCIACDCNDDNDESSEKPADENVIQFPAVIAQDGEHPEDQNVARVEGQDYWIFEFAPVLNESKCPDFVSRHRIRRLVDYDNAANF